MYKWPSLLKLVTLPVFIHLKKSRTYTNVHEGFLNGTIWQAYFSLITTVDYFLSHENSWYVLSLFSWDVADAGPKKWESYFKLSLPCLHSQALWLIVTKEGAESPHTTLGQWWIMQLARHSGVKNMITNRYFVLSIYFIYFVCKLRRYLCWIFIGSKPKAIHQ